MIKAAVSTLNRGGLVAFPTETVYGLGADATNAAAVQRIFTAKGRPATNPLIVHVASADIARRYAARWPSIADRLAERFWPGPLTLVLPKATSIADLATAGGSTVGLRVPNHPLALELLAAFDGPIAAPSANRSNQISPTEAAHVRSELGDAVDLILDGGPCAVGIESTVLDLTSDPPRILRPGGVSRAQIEEVIGTVDVFNGHVDASITAASPGQHLRHYAPRTPAMRFDAEQIDEVIRYMSARNLRAGLITTRPRTMPGHVVVTQMPGDAEAYARELYRALRDADSAGLQMIFIDLPTGDAAWDAVRDRIRRATIAFGS